MQVKYSISQPKTTGDKKVRNELTLPIHIHLLGTPLIEINGERITLPYKKLYALMAYLSVTGRRHSRVSLATLLWGESDDLHARSSLRNALSSLHQAFEPYLVIKITPSDVALDTESIWLDIADFKSILRQEKSAAGLRKGLDLWRGPFLDGLAVNGAPGFDEWLTPIQTQLDSIHEDGWLALSQAYESAGMLHEAIDAANTMLTLNPLRERGHRQLIRLYCLQEDRMAAAQQYERCRKLLENELGVSPDPRTQALYQKILSGQTSKSGHIPARTRSDGISAFALAFVGRQSEMDHISNELRFILENRQPRLLLIRGEAGLGKTRLAQEWLQRSFGLYRLTGRCFEAENSVPYHPWIDLLRASWHEVNWRKLNLAKVWMVELGRLAPEINDDIQSRIPDYSPDPELLRGRLSEAVRLWLEALCNQQPVCLFLDDIQWMDQASLALLEYILRRSSGQPLFILGAERETETDLNLKRAQEVLVRENLCSFLDLSPLTLNDITALSLTLGVGEMAPPHFFERLYTETEGNPLFVVETLRMLQTEPLSLTDEWPVPSTVQGVISSRINRLSSSTRSLLSVATVIGRNFDYLTLKEVTGQPSELVLSAIEEGCQSGLIAERGTDFNFNHEKVQSVLYASLTGMRRKYLHQRVVEYLMKLPDSRLPSYFSLISTHLEQAGELSQSRDYALLAASRAVELYADEDALVQYQRSLRLCQSGLDEELPAEFASKMIPFYSPANEPSGTLGVTPLIHSQLGLIYQRLGRYPEAENEFSQALASAQTRQRYDEQAFINNMFSFLCYLRSNYEALVNYAQLAIQCAEAIDHLSQKAVGLTHLGIASYRLGNYQRALELYSQALEIHDSMEDQLWMGACHNNIGIVKDALGDYDGAIISFQKALELRKKLGQIEGQSVHLTNIGQAYLHAGNSVAARQVLNQALALCEQVHASWVTVKIQRTLSQTAILERDWQGALEYARYAERLAEELGSYEDLGIIYRLLGEIAAGWPESTLGEPLSFTRRSVNLLSQVGDQYELSLSRRNYEQQLQMDRSTKV